ncbi:transcription elongation factor A protein 3 isoform X3 [Electrophorus electricus]|uniref:Transcription elongation factor A (SII), 3 n=1 Tax=Electrophorus electricus TaxID=8005 RepID=A0A4W4EQX9_ELEEL|nr:transcription elongation factor A protein 3 isoform X3 [Electrophorus electricus]
MTREEDLVRIAKKLDKMVSRNNTEGALDLLRELKNFNMTLKLLQETRIGMSVNGVRKHCTDEDVVSLAKILIKNWKRLLESTHSQKAERPNDLKNENEASKQMELPSGLSPDRESSPKSFLDPHKKLTDKHTKEKRGEQLQKEKQESDHRKEKHLSNHTKDKGRIDALDSTVFPPLPSHPSSLKCPAEVKKERRDAPVDFFPAPPLHPPAHPRRPSTEVKKERKEAVHPDAAPLPLHLHPPIPTKRLSLEMKKDKEKERKDTSATPKQAVQQRTSEHKKDRDVGGSKPPKTSPVEAKRERKDSPDLRQQPSKKLSQDGKKERKDSTDSKSGQRRQSSDSKPQRRDSVNSKSGSSPPPAKKLSCERRESHGSKSSHPGAQPRKLSTDSNDGWKSKAETPKTPSTPSSPLSPTFSCGGGPLSPRLLTGDSIRDKCIDMLSAALRTDDDYKDYGANCDAMASEIEDHIYQEIKATDMKYKNRVRSRISNLKDPKNPNLRKNVLGGAIELSRIATMTAEEMASDELKQLRSVLTQEAIREHQMAKTGGTTTDLLQCSKCKKKNCTYNQVQTRSADEPMTTFVLCNECGNRWKFC